MADPFSKLARPPASGGTTASPTLPGAVTAFTQDDIIELVERVLPNHYTAPLKDPGPGWEVVQAMAKVGARISTAVENLGSGGYILSSGGPAQAVGSVELYRPAVHPDGITVVVKQGTIVRSSRGGRTYATTEDATFLAADLGPFLVAVKATRPGYQYNEPGIVVTLDGTSLPGEIDSIDTLVEDPDYGDATILVRHPVETTGGADAALDEHGADRQIARSPGELDDSYRGRIRALPDNISPNAVDRALQQILFPFGLSYAFIETWDVAFQTCWDAPADLPLPGSNYDPNLFVYDDPRDPTPFRNRWLDESIARGAFIVVVPNLQPVTDRGFLWQSSPASPPDADAMDLLSTVGKRSLGAYDVAPADLGTDFLGPGCWDGFDDGKNAVYSRLYATLQRIRAAGVVAVLELQGE